MGTIIGKPERKPSMFRIDENKAIEAAYKMGFEAACQRKLTRDELRDLVLRVYNARVDADSGPGSADRMIERDGDGGKKQIRRSMFYHPVVVETLVQLGLYDRPIPDFGRGRRKKDD
jgi:hypothetical protein